MKSPWRSIRGAISALANFAFLFGGRDENGRSTGIVGTIAMFLVGGGILVHALAPLHHLIQSVTPSGFIGSIVGQLGNAIVGIITGAIVLAAVMAFQKLRGKKPAH